jgi:MYXO-CTERM domain-containing protein
MHARLPSLLLLGALALTTRPAEACSLGHTCWVAAAPEGRWPSGGALLVYCPSSVRAPIEEVVHIEAVDGATVAFTATSLIGDLLELRVAPQPVDTVLRVTLHDHTPNEWVVGPAQEDTLQVTARAAAFTMTCGDRYDPRYEACRREGTRVELTEVTSSAPLAALVLSGDLPFSGVVPLDVTTRTVLWPPIDDEDAAPVSTYTLYGSDRVECFDVTAIDFAGRRAALPRVCVAEGCGCTTTDDSAASPLAVVIVGLVALRVRGRRRRG